MCPPKLMFHGLYEKSQFREAIHYDQHDACWETLAIPRQRMDRSLVFLGGGVW